MKGIFEKAIKSAFTVRWPYIVPASNLDIAQIQQTVYMTKYLYGTLRAHPNIFQAPNDTTRNSHIYQRHKVKFRSTFPTTNVWQFWYIMVICFAFCDGIRQFLKSNIIERRRDYLFVVFIFVYGWIVFVWVYSCDVIFALFYLKNSFSYEYKC